MIPRSVVIFLALGLVAASQSGNIIRLADASPVAIAAWRLVIATALLTPLAGRKLGSLRQLSGREWLYLLGAGLALAAHFITWIWAVQLTTVANAAVFFSINPVFTATAAFLFFGERVTRRLAIAIVVGIVGVVVMGLADLQFRPEQTAGNALAVLCSLLFTVYFLLGKRLRQRLDNRVYVPALYGVAAVACLVALPVLDLPVVGFERGTWFAFLLMALVPTMIGHTSLNMALKYIDAGRISVLTLSEPLFAGVVAYFAWGESFSWSTGVGYVLIGAAVLLLFGDRWSNPGELAAESGVKGR